MLGLVVKPCTRWSRAAATRSFSSNQSVMLYTRVVVLLWRVLCGRDELQSLNNPESKLYEIFDPSASKRERLSMRLLTMMTSEIPLDLYAFRQGAKQAAHVVFNTLYEMDENPLLKSVATEECIDHWKLIMKRKQQMLSSSIPLQLERIDVKNIFLSQVEYSFSYDQEQGFERVLSKYLMYESMKIHATLQVTEHYQLNSTSTAIDSTMIWTFESDVARPDVIDWVITNAITLQSSIVANIETNQ